MKLLMSALLLIAMGLIPEGSVPETPVQRTGGGAALSYTVEIVGEADGSAPNDAGMLLEPDVSVDPGMLIVVEADNDPGFIIGRAVIYIIR
jgi:hypothetical protein